jgi:hypothetical protein
MPIRVSATPRSFAFVVFQNAVGRFRFSRPSSSYSVCPRSSRRATSTGPKIHVRRGGEAAFRPEPGGSTQDSKRIGSPRARRRAQSRQGGTGADSRRRRVGILRSQIAGILPVAGRRGCHAPSGSPASGGADKRRPRPCGARPWVGTGAEIRFRSRVIKPAVAHRTTSITVVVSRGSFDRAPEGAAAAGRPVNQSAKMMFTRRRNA